MLRFKERAIFWPGLLNFFLKSGICLKFQNCIVCIHVFVILLDKIFFSATSSFHFPIQATMSISD